MAQVETHSDPIFGSLGYEAPEYPSNRNGTNNTDFSEAKFENYLNRLKPVVYHNDENVNTTWSSLAWAEQ
jgi:hypothetical protein